MEGDSRHVVTHDLTILHVVGPVTDEVFSFLGPATRKLARSGHLQSIVVVDMPQLHHNVEQLDEVARLIRVPRFANPLKQWNALFSACRAQIRGEAFDALHVHGLIPCILASVALRWASLQTPILYSPHGSRSIGALRLAGRLAMLAAHPVVRPLRSSAIVTVPREAQALDTSWGSTELIESPVDDVFFTIARAEAPRPLIVTGGRHNSARSVEVFSQLAVLLSGEELGLGFHWLGTVSEASRKRLAAADVDVRPIADSRGYADALSRGWMYVAPWSTRGFPLFLVQAMAAGLPCVALDCEQHREVIKNGVTGFLCASEQEMVRWIAALVDDAALRKMIGTAARNVAIARFGEAEFGERLLSAYPLQSMRTGQDVS
ncbi:glycosyltransferase family 4 protein [Variovorax sp. LT1P1]|uniref:glycosyltransferase family 4 protein n=1 Tax=Variovorax sp. LT1P1 TaxID=3443730 RepID=UPI003F457DD1